MTLIEMLNQNPQAMDDLCNILADDMKSTIPTYSISYKKGFKTTVDFEPDCIDINVEVVESVPTRKPETAPESDQSRGETLIPGPCLPEQSSDDRL